MTLASLITNAGKVTFSSVPSGAVGLALAEVYGAAAGRSLLMVCASDREMDMVAGTLPFFLPGAEVLSLPAWDCLPYDRVSPNSTIIAERLATLCRLAERKSDAKPVILLTTAAALLQKLPPRSVLAAATFTIRPGKALDRDGLVTFLLANGYRRSGKVMEPGEFALRGSIIDLFAPGHADALRLDCFGDDVESIRYFDPMTQRSGDKVESATLRPVGEVLLYEAAVASFRTRYRELFGVATSSDMLYESVSEGRAHAGMEHWLPLFYERLDTVFGYLPGAVVLFNHQVALALSDRAELILDYYGARKAAAEARDKSAAPYRALAPDMLYLDEAALERALSGLAQITLSPFVAADAEGTAMEMGLRGGRDFASVRQAGENPFEALKDHAAQKRGEGKATVIACYSQGTRERIGQMLTEHGLHSFPIERWEERRQVKGKSTGLAILPVEHGFESADAVLLSEQDLLGERILRKARKRKSSEQFLAEAAGLSEGELVVHREHGIGRFDGLVTVEVGGIRHDCLKLVYEGDDRLFLPVENMEMVTRYGSEHDGVKLDKLGAANWQARKARLKERIKLAAEELIRTAAARAIETSDVLAPAHGPFAEFCARFPYQETEDQAKAIDEVLEDMARGRPTDRLICGDVGFGKTEVALRAAFAACSAEGGGVQVAVVTPTTLLCRQHYATFRERFAGLPVRIRQLSRLVSAKEAKENAAGIAKGEVDIAIGTHALLGKSIEFKNLGLLIIDEEQHFGVAQKEALKKLKSSIHVLTLSATPIPRTLQLALTGVRELSLITTPPVDRLAVRSFVLPYDPVVLREAILREYHRGGKIFYVTPRVQYIAELRQRIMELVPEIRIAVAHGQMAPGKLDGVMNEFYDGKYDLLLCTTIIESGLDVPTANTMIIDRADRFGLSQLYQLRGRVGRGKIRAYAYFTLPHGKQLSSAAVKRLEVMQTLDTLGGGFTVASHDMDIRGFGNLLGDEQSGHVREVGIELYQQMLEEAVAEARRNAKNVSRETISTSADEQWSPTINLGASVLIPEHYVSDLDLRLSLYRRSAALLNNEEIESFAAELIDRFGPLPVEAQHYLAVLKLKILCKQANIERLDAGPKGLVVAFRNNIFAKPDVLLDYIAKRAREITIRPDQRLVIQREWRSLQDKISGVSASVNEIAKMAA